MRPYQVVGITGGCAAIFVILAALSGLLAWPLAIHRGFALAAILGGIGHALAIAPRWLPRKRGA